MRSAELLKVLASVLMNWNQPVSVATATNSACAIFSVIGQFAYFNKSRTMRAVAAAVVSSSSTLPSPSEVT